MSAQRRTMTAALQTGELNDEAMAFIRGDNVKRAITSTPSPVESLPEKTSPVPEVEPAPVPAAKTPSKPSLRVMPAMVNLSTRIPADLQERLMRASLDRKIGQQEPSTHQDIVTEALANWLKKAGYP